MRWTDKITLRQASALGSFAGESYLPLRYGQTSGKAARMNARGTRWLWADHAVSAVDSVRLDGLKITGWTWANETDATGRAIAVITLTEAPEATAELHASGRGKPGLTNPADVACDALGLDSSSMAVFRAECDRLGYVAGGTVTEQITRQALARAIASSFGAFFTPAELIFYPSVTASAAVEVGDIATEGAPFGAVTASFDYADGEPQQTVTMRARAGDTDVVALEWVQSQRVAIAVAERVAIDRSGQLWEFGFTARDKRIGAGASIDFDVAPFGATVASVTNSTYDFADSEGSAQFRTGRATSASLEHQSAKFGADGGTAATVTRVGDDVAIVVLDSVNDLPLSNAKCTLDGAMIRYSDAAGVVKFPAYAVDDGRPHRVRVEAAGRPVFDIAL